jgi:hypothetical protein
MSTPVRGYVPPNSGDHKQGHKYFFYPRLTTIVNLPMTRQTWQTRAQVWVGGCEGWGGCRYKDPVKGTVMQQLSCVLTHCKKMDTCDTSGNVHLECHYRQVLTGVVEVLRGPRKIKRQQVQLTCFVETEDADLAADSDSFGVQAVYSFSLHTHDGSRVRDWALTKQETA